MFVTFFQELKAAGVPVTLREYLTLMQAMEADLASRRVEDFYYLSRATLVKDERNLDKFDRVFGHVFKGLELLSDAIEAEIPAEWLKKLAEKYLTEEEKKQIEAMGGLDKLLETLRKRLAEQKGRHQGGSKWIGTAGTSPYGAYGYNPEGVRIGQDESRNIRAVKVWDKREFKDLDDEVELGTRNIKIALRRLRKFARTGAPEELDLDGTIKGTAHKGYLDILMRPERHNAVKVLLFFDIGGSMDWHIKATEELFSAARTEFKHMEHFYFHNCLYEKVWKENRRRYQETTPTWDVLHTYPHDYKVVFVGDASMSPYEITRAGRLGRALQRRAGRARGSSAWRAPIRRRCGSTRCPRSEWDFTYSIQMVQPADGRADVSADAGGAGSGDAGVGAVSSRPTRRREYRRSDASSIFCAVATAANNVRDRQVIQSSAIVLSPRVARHRRRAATSPASLAPRGRHGRARCRKGFDRQSVRVHRYRPQGGDPVSHCLSPRSPASVNWTATARSKPWLCDVSASRQPPAQPGHGLTMEGSLREGGPSLLFGALDAAGRRKPFARAHPRRRRALT